MISTLVRGKVAFVLKVIFLSLLAAIIGLLAQSAFAQREYVISGFLWITLLLLLITYLTNVSIPLKFFIPGLLLLFAFVMSPIIYTVTMSGFNYKTGNIISKGEAIIQVQSRAESPDPAGTTFDIKIGTTGRVPAVLASDIANKKYFLTTEKSLTSISAAQVTLDTNGVAVSVPGFTALTADQMGAADRIYTKIHFVYKAPYYLTLQGFDVGVIMQTTLKYDSMNGSFVSLIDNKVYKDNGRGNFANVSNSKEILEPGWRAPIWFENYKNLFTDPRIRAPLIKVFLWTVVFALSTVLTTFALGLMLALVMNKPLFGRRFYRSILILPYAMPSVMSILIWGGMFNTEFGAINNLFGIHVAWLSNPTTARLAVILVNLWLGFPYFYLVSSGALQAIPSELLEAAAIDGANPRQIFRKITLPLLLQILSPLLIASFAYNFNNFNLIYLLTGGGPSDTLSGQIAGATDILISYTYKIAFGSNVQDLGLASAISLVIFVLVASISMYGLKKSKVMESFK